MKKHLSVILLLAMILTIFPISLHTEAAGDVLEVISGLDLTPYGGFMRIYFDQSLFANNNNRLLQNVQAIKSGDDYNAAVINGVLDGLLIDGKTVREWNTQWGNDYGVMVSFQRDGSENFVVLYTDAGLIDASANVSRTVTVKSNFTSYSGKKAKGNALVSNATTKAWSFATNPILGTYNMFQHNINALRIHFGHDLSPKFSGPENNTISFAELSTPSSPYYDKTVIDSVLDGVLINGKTIRDWSENHNLNENPLVHFYNIEFGEVSPYFIDVHPNDAVPDLQDGDIHSIEIKNTFKDLYLRSAVSAKFYLDPADMTWSSTQPVATATPSPSPTPPPVLPDLIENSNIFMEGYAKGASWDRREINIKLPDALWTDSKGEYVSLELDSQINLYGLSTAFKNGLHNKVFVTMKGERKSLAEWENTVQGLSGGTSPFASLNFKPHYDGVSTTFSLSLHTMALTLLDFDFARDLIEIEFTSGFVTPYTDIPVEPIKFTRSLEAFIAAGENYAPPWTVSSYGELTLPTVSLEKSAGDLYVKIDDWKSDYKYQIWAHEKTTSAYFDNEPYIDNQWVLAHPYTLGSDRGANGFTITGNTLTRRINNFETADGNYTVAVKVIDAYGNYVGQFKNSFTADDVGEPVIGKILIDGIFADTDRTVIKEITPNANVNLSVSANQIPGISIQAHIRGINEDKITASGSNPKTFNWDISSFKPGKYTMIITASAAGNEQIKEISFTLFTQDTSIDYGILNSMSVTGSVKTGAFELGISTDGFADKFAYTISEPWRNSFYSTTLPTMPPNFQNLENRSIPADKYGYYQVTGYVYRNGLIIYDDGAIATINHKRPTDTSLDVSVSGAPQNTTNKGNNITLSASSTGIPNAQYSFWRRDANGWVMIRDYETGSSLIWKPNRVGSYTIQTRVREGGSSPGLTYEQIKNLEFEITHSTEHKAQITDVSINLDELSINSRERKPVEIIAQAEGSSEDLLYKYIITNNFIHYVETPYSASPAYTWVPGKAGDYKINVLVKNSQSFGKYDFIKTFNLNVGETEKAISAEVRISNGLPRLYINNEIQTGNAFFGNTDYTNSNAITTSQAEHAANNGIHTHSIIHNLNYNDEEDPNIYFGPLYSQLNVILQADPQARIFLRVNVGDFSFYGQKGTLDEYMAFVGGDRSDLISFASDRWYADANQRLYNLVEHIREHPVYSKHVFGYHLECSEWFQYMYREKGSDISPVADAKFRSWLTAKYGNNSALQAAWGSTSYTLANAQVPGDLPDNTQNTGYARSLLLNQNETRFADYFDYIGDLVSDTIAGFASTVKDASDGENIVLAFYGYYFDLFDAQSGHFSFRKLLNNPDLDGFASPVTYIDRKSDTVGASSAYMTAINSVISNGKLWFQESDQRTYIERKTHPAQDNYHKLPNTPMVNETHKREIGANLVYGSSVYPMDLYGMGWYDDNAIWRNFKKLDDLNLAYIKGVTKAPEYEVALVVDETAESLVGTPTELTRNLLKETRGNLYKAGISFAMFELQDVLDGKADGCKIFIFLNPYRMSTATINQLAQKIQKDNKVSVFMYGFGNTSSADIFNLTKMNMTRQNSKLSLRLNAESQTVIPGAGALPATKDTQPRTYVTSGHTTTLGKYNSGGQVGYAMHKASNFTTVFCGAAHLDIANIRALAKYSGANVFIETDDIVTANDHLVCLHSSSAGQKIITFKEPVDVYDYFSGTWHLNVTSYTVSYLQKGYTKYLFYGKQADILAMNLPAWTIN